MRTVTEASEPGELDPLGWLDQRAADREAAGLRRRLHPRGAARDLLDLAGNDYLGLCRHPSVLAGARDAITAFGAGATGSRLVTGSTTLHADLERELAAFVGTPAALVFSSGYLANLGAVSALAGPGDLIVSDAHNHASIIDGCRLSRAQVAVVAHRDPAAVGRLLAGRAQPRALVVTDGVFSVDGELAPLAELAEVCRTHGATLLVDDAHGLGVVGALGRGSVAAAGLAGAPDVVITATLSKSLGSQGGVVLGGAKVIAHLIDAARPFIFDTGLSPAAAGAALAALRELRARPALAAAVRDRAGELSGLAGGLGLAVSTPAAAVVSIALGDPGGAVRAARRCAEAGVLVGCFRPPSVPDGISRLRLTARADLTEADLRLVAGALARLADPA